MVASIVPAVVARRWVRPSWFAVLLTMAGVAAFSSLGFWQLRRAADKEMLLAAFTGASAQQPVELAEARRHAAAGLYPHVRVRGWFDPVHTYVLDDQVRDGRQGRFSFAIFVPEDGAEALLVNRGFLPRAESETQPALPDGEVELSGLYAPAPGSGLRLGGNVLPKSSRWPKLTIYIDPSEIAQDAGRELDDRVLLLDPDPASAFVREWTPQIMPPERHRGYAFQWFCFAFASLVIFVVLHWRRQKPGLN